MKALLVSLLLLLLTPACQSSSNGDGLDLRTVSRQLGIFERSAEAYRSYYMAPGEDGITPRNSGRAERWFRLKTEVTFVKAAVDASLTAGLEHATVVEAVELAVIALGPLAAEEDEELVPIVLGALTLLEALRGLTEPQVGLGPPSAPSPTLGYASDSRAASRRVHSGPRPAPAF